MRPSFSSLFIPFISPKGMLFLPLTCLTLGFFLSSRLHSSFTQLLGLLNFSSNILSCFGGHLFALHCTTTNQSAPMPTISHSPKLAADRQHLNPTDSRSLMASCSILFPLAFVFTPTPKTPRQHFGGETAFVFQYGYCREVHISQPHRFASLGKLKLT